MEVWRDVVGYEGIYEVSSQGRVRTHKNKTTYTERHGTRRWKQRYLKEKNPNGRDVRFTLWSHGSPKSFLGHRLVAEAFIPKVSGKESVNHIDGDPRNNDLSNLEWCDYKENNNHAFDNGLISTAKKVVLINTNTKQEYAFRSYAAASFFLGKNHGYISEVLKEGKTGVGDYLIKVKN